MWEYILLSRLWLLVAIVAIVLAIRATTRVRRLTARLDSVERRLAAMDEAQLAARARQIAEAPVAPPAAASEPWPASIAELAAEPAVPADALPPMEPSAIEPLAPEHAIPEPVAPIPPPAPRPRESLESKIGARWSVIVGGLALGLGAVFLVRYSIEQGLLSERMRIALGFALAGILFIAGEVLRRRDRAVSAPVFAKADVPAVVTGAGSVALFATIYAAYALYGFIDSALAFVLLTAAGLFTLVLSAIHGPGLAALGTLASFVTPLLVSSAQPQPIALVLHTLAVTGSVLSVARIRNWRWLAIAGMVGAIPWGLVNGFQTDAETTRANLLLIAGLVVIVIGTLVAGRGLATVGDEPQDPVALGALTAIAALSLYYAEGNPTYPALLSGIVLAGALGAGASRWPSIAAASLIAGVLAVLTVMLLPAPLPPGMAVVRVGALEWMVLGDEGLAAFALKAAAIAAVVGIGAFFNAERSARAAPLAAGFSAAAGAGAPYLIMVVVYLRHVPFETRPAFGMAALAMAAIFAAMTERLIAKRPSDIMAPAPAFYAAGAVLALSFAIAVGLDTRLIPLAFSLGAAGVAFVALYRPVAVLPWLAALLAALACVALFRHAPLIAAEIGTRPFFNGLITRFGLPALAILLAGEMLRRVRPSPPAAILQAIGLALAGLFIVLEIRHFANDGVLVAGPPGLGEQSALTLAALAFSFAVQEIGRRTGSKVYGAAAMVAGVCGVVAIVLAHLIVNNPLFTGESVGAHPVLNLLLSAYLLPAIAAAWLAASGRKVRPPWYSMMIAALSVTLALAYISLMVRHSFHGPVLAGGGVADAENWTYSAIWLAFGIALLAAGIRLGSVTVRAASGVVIALVICKVFLLDMGNLTGALRAVSFLGLGVTLIVIGRIYQRLLMRRPPPEPAAA